MIEDSIASDCFAQRGYVVEKPRNESSENSEDIANAQDEGAETVRSVDGKELGCSVNRVAAQEHLQRVRRGHGCKT